MSDAAGGKSKNGGAGAVSATAAAAGGPQPVRQKKSSFQITSVTATRMSNDAADDSADDLDESHTDDISRVTEGNETPSFSEDTFSKDDVFFNAGSASLCSAPVIPTSSQYGLAIVPTHDATGPAASDALDVINIGNVKTEPSATEPHVTTRNERFKLPFQPKNLYLNIAQTTFIVGGSKKSTPVLYAWGNWVNKSFERCHVVKIESTEPFKRGRWQCMDYLDHSGAGHDEDTHEPHTIPISTPKQVQVQLPANAIASASQPANNPLPTHPNPNQQTGNMMPNAVTQQQQQQQQQYQQQAGVTLQPAAVPAPSQPMQIVNPSLVNSQNQNTQLPSNVATAANPGMLPSSQQIQHHIQTVPQPQVPNMVQTGGMLPSNTQPHPSIVPQASQPQLPLATQTQPPIQNQPMAPQSQPQQPIAAQSQPQQLPITSQTQMQQPIPAQSQPQPTQAQIQQPIVAQQQQQPQQQQLPMASQVPQSLPTQNQQMAMQQPIAAQSQPQQMPMASQAQMQQPMGGQGQFQPAGSGQSQPQSMTGIPQAMQQAAGQQQMQQQLMQQQMQQQMQYYPQAMHQGGGMMGMMGQYPVQMPGGYPQPGYVSAMPQILPQQMMQPNFQNFQQQATSSPSYPGSVAGPAGYSTSQPHQPVMSFSSQPQHPPMSAYPQVMMPQMVAPAAPAPAPAPAPVPHLSTESDLQAGVALLESLVEANMAVTAGAGEPPATEDPESVFPIRLAQALHAYKERLSAANASRPPQPAPSRAPSPSPSASGTSAVAIDNKIEQAMDLVKSHLMFAVREEVEVLREKIAELMDRINLLELENSVLKSHATPDTLASLAAQVTAAPAPAAAPQALPTGPPPQPPPN